MNGLLWKLSANVLLIPFQVFVHLKMWIWFLTPLGIPTPNKWVIFGLVMWVSHLSNWYVGPNIDKETQVEQWIRAVIVPNFRLLLILGFGFIYHLLAIR